MYRQANEALKRGDVFQQRPCPFYNEMHGIFSATEPSSLTSNAQFLLNEDDDDELGDEDKQISVDQEDNLLVEAPTSRTTDERLTHAIDRLIEYQERNEVGLGSVRVPLEVQRDLLPSDSMVHVFGTAGGPRVATSTRRSSLSTATDSTVGQGDFE